MKNYQVDANKIIEKLSKQIAEQSTQLAILQVMLEEAEKEIEIISKKNEECNEECNCEELECKDTECKDKSAK